MICGFSLSAISFSQSGVYTYISWNYSMNLYHGTIVWTGITWKKTHCYMFDLACSWFSVKKAKTFWSYIFEFKIFKKI